MSLSSLLFNFFVSTNFTKMSCCNLTTPVPSEVDRSHVTAVVIACTVLGLLLVCCVYAIAFHWNTVEEKGKQQLEKRFSKKTPPSNNI